MRLHNVRLLTSEGLSMPRTAELPVDDDGNRDASGLILSPGWIDLHAHLRDPGFPEKETLQTGSASAAFGGFTQVVAMANTSPVTDSPERLRALVARSQSLPVRVSFVGAVTNNLEGKTLTDAKALKLAGAVALSDDGRHAMDVATLRRALRSAAEADLPVFIHPQREALGTSPDAEVAAVDEALDALADVPAARLHLQHVSTRRTVDLLRSAKRDGLLVTAEVTPHHLTLTHQDVEKIGLQGNVNPPLRSEDDRGAVLEALAEGVIDVVATDHAPHDAAAKAAGASGFHGFETALPVVLGLGLEPGVLYRACVQGPREISGDPLLNASNARIALKRGSRGPAGPNPPRKGEGNFEDWIVIDPELEWTVDPSSFRSRGRNTLLAGRRLRGRVVMTVCRGQLLFERMLQRV